MVLSFVFSFFFFFTRSVLCYCECWKYSTSKRKCCVKREHHVGPYVQWIISHSRHPPPPPPPPSTRFKQWMGLTKQQADNWVGGYLAVSNAAAWLNMDAFLSKYLFIFLSVSLSLSLKKSKMGKDPKKPRGKMSSYAYFVQTCRSEHKKKHPEASVNFAEFSKKCSERWKVK